MTIVCNIWMICLELNWFVYDPSLIAHFWNCLDTTFFGMSQKRLFFVVSLYPLSFFANTPFNINDIIKKFVFLPNFFKTTSHHNKFIRLKTRLLYSEIVNEVCRSRSFHKLHWSTTWRLLYWLSSVRWIYLSIK